MKLRAIAAFAVCCIALAGCSASESWTATVYPDGDRLDDAVTLGSFPSRISCAVASLDVLDRLGHLDEGDYECGRNCERHADLPALYVCDATEKPIAQDALRVGGQTKGAIAAIHAECMKDVARLHRTDFLTYPLQVKVKLGLADPELARRYEAFVEAVECLSASSTDIVPRSSMAPTEFEVFFDQHAERLGLRERISR